MAKPRPVTARSPFLVKTWLELLVESLCALKRVCIELLLEDHQVEKVLQLRHFQRFEPSLLPHVLHELVDVFESAEDLGNKELAFRFHHSVRLDQEVREVCPHEAQTEHAHVYTLAVEGQICDVGLYDVIGALAHVERVDLALMTMVLKLELEHAFSAAEVSDNVINVLGLLELGNQHVEWVFVPLLHLITVPLMILHRHI